MLNMSIRFSKEEIQCHFMSIYYLYVLRSIDAYLLPQSPGGQYGMHAPSFSFNRPESRETMTDVMKDENCSRSPNQHNRRLTE